MLEGLIKTADLVINLAAICVPADYNAHPLDNLAVNKMNRIMHLQ